MRKRIKNWYGRNMNMINMNEDTSLADFFAIEDGNNDDAGGGADGQTEEVNNESQEQEQEQNSNDANRESDTGNDDDNASDDSVDSGTGDDDNNDSDDQIDPRDTQISQLLGMVEKLTKQKEAEVIVEPEVETDPFKTDAFDNYATVMNWDADEKAANKEFFKLMLAHNNRTTLNQAQQSIPQIVNSTMSAKEKQAAIKTSFYDEHPALADVKDYAGLIAKTVAAEHQAQGKAIDVNAVLKEAAERTYKNLKITKVNKNDNKSGNKSGSGKKPAFASNKGVRQKASKQTADQAMIGAISDLEF